jgi:RNA polymerase sigma-32 factor
VSDPPSRPQTPDDALPVPATPAKPERTPSVPARAEPRETEQVSALSRYMSQLRHYAPISREEEHDLAVRWAEGHDKEAGRQLVLSNLRLVVKIAMEYRRAWTNTLDLIQEGNLGLLEAVERFDPYKGTKLSSYAVYWIRAYVLKYLIDNIRMVRLGRTRASRKLFLRLNKEKRALEAQGFKPEPKLIAERLDVTEQDVIEMEQRLGGGELSLEAPVRGGDDGSASYGDFIATPDAPTESALADEDLRRTFLGYVRTFSADLGERDQRIMEARILADPPATLQELGDEMGVTRERVRQLEKKLVDRLRSYLQEHVVDFEFYAPSAD